MSISLEPLFFQQAGIFLSISRLMSGRILTATLILLSDITNNLKKQQIHKNRYDAMFTVKIKSVCKELTLWLSSNQAYLFWFLLSFRKMQFEEDTYIKFGTALPVLEEGKCGHLCDKQ